MNVKLEKVNESNYWECIKLPKQMYCGDNTISLVQAYIYPAWNPYCIYYNGKMVGFIMYGKDDTDNTIWIIRFNIIEGYQRKGIGTVALNYALEMIHSRYRPDRVFISTSPSNKKGLKFYEKNGFVRTGVIELDEEVLYYEFGPYDYM